jgi:hypothetical protein
MAKRKKYKSSNNDLHIQLKTEQPGVNSGAPEG